MATTHFHQFAVAQHDASFIVGQFNLPSRALTRLTPKAWCALSVDTSSNLVSKPIAQADYMAQAGYTAQADQSDELLLGVNRLIAMQMMALWMLMFIFCKSIMNHTFFYALLNL